MNNPDYYQDQHSSICLELEDYAYFNKQLKPSPKQANQTFKESLDYLPEYED